tara:strand:+ start:69 stop:260 length:192 start_codon:yes stop_codon:yes gene_type:complete
MEYTTLWQPILLIFISFSLGLFTGAFWIFCIIQKSNKRLEQELDSKTRLLTAYENNLNNKDDE